MDEDHFEFEWCVQRFSSRPIEKKIHSAKFRGPGPRGRYSWQLQILPRIKFQGIDHVAVFLRQTMGIPRSAQNRKARFQLSLIDRNGTPGHQSDSHTKILNFSSVGIVHCWTQFIPFGELTASGSPWLSKVDTLRLHCSIWVSGGGGEVKIEPEIGKRDIGTPQSSSSSQHQLQPHALSLQSANNSRDKTFEEDFGRLLREGRMADVNIVTETKTFKAHKLILSARSKVFASMFNTPMTEAASGSLRIADFDEETVKGMLEYVYGHAVNLKDPSIARSLLEIADKYDLPGLKAGAEDSILKTLTVDNAAEAYFLSHLVNATVLKSKVIEYISRYKEAVKKTADFHRLIKPNAMLLMDLV